ncbi:MAG: acetylxylan esterase, partial [Oscillospiraceae bacterium]|nr:acetylxylan esterase [Oscillospiraceae bacterium]
MRERNFSLNRYWERLAESGPPSMSFDALCGHGGMGWGEWRGKAIPKLREVLGEMPDPVALNPETVYSVADGDLIRERVVIDSEEFMSVPCQVLRPAGMKPDGANAAILCCHGHGLGKDLVAGMPSTPDHAQRIKNLNYDYGLQMAKAGFLTVMPDLRGFGERKDHDPVPMQRDPCNVHYIKGAAMGRYPMALNIWDMMRVIDYMQSRPEVDPERIGMMGLSYGGTMTAYVSALDGRVKAADISGYVTPFAKTSIRDGNFCGMQTVPMLNRHFDAHDVAGLIA